MVVLGIDLRTSPNHPSAVALLGGKSGVEYLDKFSTNEDLEEVVGNYRPELIAIGTPLGLPEGLCCLESSCGCGGDRSQKKGRQSELELARMGISCFFTNKGSIVRNLIYRGIELRKQLRESDFEVIEVYAHATEVILFGDKVPPRKSAAGLMVLNERLGPLIGCIGSYMVGMDRNGCDAVLNAYTGFLHTQNETDVLGSEEEGTLVLPNLPK